MNSALKSITINDGLEIIGNSAFKNTNLSSVVLPSSVEYVQREAFAGCKKLESIDLKNVSALGNKAFSSCTSLESIDLTGVRTEEDTFEGCINLKKVYFTKDKETKDIADKEFEGNETIETVVIGGSISEIKSRAFASCPKLESAFIADTVTEIDDTAFEGCDNLTIVCTENSPAMLFAQRNSISYTTLVIMPITNRTYTGKEIKPIPRVKVGDVFLKNNTDFVVSYADNINIGTARVTVAGLGDYSIYAATATFKIVKPKVNKPKTTRVKKKKGLFRLFWYFIGRITGFHIRLSTSRFFRAKQTSNFYLSASRRSKVFRKLKKNKTYYVKIRAYRKIGDKTFYSGWSKTKKVKL